MTHIATTKQRVPRGGEGEGQGEILLGHNRPSLHSLCHAVLRPIPPQSTSKKKVNDGCSHTILRGNQKQCLAAIVKYRNRYGRSPIYRTLATLLGLSARSKAYAHRLVMELEAKGYVRTPLDRSWRSIEVLRLA